MFAESDMLLLSQMEFNFRLWKVTDWFSVYYKYINRQPHIESDSAYSELMTFLEKENLSSVIDRIAKITPKTRNDHFFAVEYLQRIHEKLNSPIAIMESYRRLEKDDIAYADIYRRLKDYFDSSLEDGAKAKLLVDQLPEKYHFDLLTVMKKEDEDFGFKLSVIDQLAKLHKDDPAFSIPNTSNQPMTELAVSNVKTLSP